MAHSPFPHYTLRGNAFDIGVEHGTILKDRIDTAIKFYKNLFQRDEEWLKKAAMYFGQKIKEFSAELYSEMEGIAKGSEQPLYLIIALNSRSEIMTYERYPDPPISKSTTECTSLCFVDHCILAQTWDWFQNIQPLPVLFTITKENLPFNIITFTEPGIVAKLGMNSAGVSVGLNFLNSGTPCTGVPVHVVIRSILESPSLDNWKSTHQHFLREPGISAAVTVGTNVPGKFTAFEFYNKFACEVEPQISLPEYGNVYCRANHYLHPKITYDIGKTYEAYPSSIDRQTSAEKLLKEVTSPTNGDLTFDGKFSDKIIPKIKNILQNPSVNKVFAPHRHFTHLNIGTVAVVVMDLSNMEIHVSANENPRENIFKVVHLSSKE